MNICTHFSVCVSRTMWNLDVLDTFFHVQLYEACTDRYIEWNMYVRFWHTLSRYQTLIHLMVNCNLIILKSGWVTVSHVNVYYIMVDSKCDSQFANSFLFALAKLLALLCCYLYHAGCSFSTELDMFFVNCVWHWCMTREWKNAHFLLFSQRKFIR